MAEVLASLARGELYNAAPLDRSRRTARTRCSASCPHTAARRRRRTALKEIVVVPANPSRGLDTHQGSVLLHDGETGELLAIMNASPITEIRTAAVSGGRDARARAAGRAARGDPRRGRAGARSRRTRCAWRARRPRSGSGRRDTRERRASSPAEVGATVAPIRRRGALRRRRRLHDDRVGRADRRERAGSRAART